MKEKIHYEQDYLYQQGIRKHDVCFNSKSMGIERISRLIAESFSKIVNEEDIE